MQEIPFIGLLNNTALLLALGVVYGALQKRSDGLGWRVLRGGLLGLFAVGVMVNPWQLAPGMIFDSRTIMLSVGGLFLGPLPTAIATVIAGLYRALVVGGVGAFTGTLWVVTAGLFGIVWAHVRKVPAHTYRDREFYLFGLVLHLILLLEMFTMPQHLVMPILKNITLPILIIFPVASVLLAKLFAAQDRQMISRQALDRSEQKYRELVQSSRVILLRVDNRGDVTFINEYAQHFFGYSQDEILGRSVIGTIVPSYTANGEDLEAMVRSCMTAPEDFAENENENICSDGRRVQILWKNTPLYGEDGELAGIQCIGHDMTELRKAETILRAREEQLQRLVDITPVPLAIVEGRNRVDYVNRAFSDTFGYRLEDLVNVEDLWLKAFPDQAKCAAVKCRWEQAVNRVIERGEAFEPQEMLVSCKDGSIRDVVTMFSFIGSRGVVVLHDVTRERELGRMKSEFVATTAHELRTPLASIRGFSELLLSDHDFEPEKKREFLQVIYDKTEILERIIDDLLTLGRIEAGRAIHLEKSECRIRDLIANAVHSYSVEYPDREFSLDWAEGIPTLMFVDGVRISQVMENLLNNAIKFSPATSPIQISGSVAGEGLQLSVKDSGIGLDAEQAGRAFDRFYRANNADSAAPGMGLGLAISKSIVEAHGGEISLLSLPDQGAEVIFKLPLAG